MSARDTLYICNDSDAVIYLGFDTAAVLNKGIRLNANGGSLVDETYTGAVYGITAVASKNITIMQTYIYTPPP
jgi:hypothetical protein